MNIRYREATELDFPVVLELIKELAKFEKAEHKVTNTVAQMIQEQEYFNCILAENEETKVLGIALYYFTYSTWVGKALYLEDLYVRKQYRGHNIGSNLVAEIFKVAKEERCKRVRWQVLDWNEPAIKFYNKLGATLDDEWINCDFNEQQINDFVL